MAPVLSSSAGDSYFWFKDGVSIGSGQVFVATEEGVYAVQVVQIGGCQSELSDPISIVITGDLKSILSSTPILYPNPESDQVTLYLGGFEKDKIVFISIIDAQGRILEIATGLGEHEISFNVHTYASGEYIVLLQQDKVKVTRQFIKADK